MQSSNYLNNHICSFEMRDFKGTVNKTKQKKNSNPHVIPNLYNLLYLKDNSLII